jgi:PPM family protein phosphatase
VTAMANDTSLLWAAATDVGQVRSNNQDRYLAQPEERLWVVADGMGGHRGGEVAAQIASDEIGVRFVDRTPEGLATAIVSANAAVFQAGSDDPDLAGMGTTVVALAVVDEGDREVLAIASVGDSRVYRFRPTDSLLEQLTEDHSLVADMVREGSIAPEEAATHPQRNILTRVLGVYEDVPVDMLTVDPQLGDRFLLCSDGLFNEVPEERIGSTMRRLAHPRDVADELVRQAVESGGRDNVTVVIVDVVDGSGNGAGGVTATGTREQPVAGDLAPFSGGAYADTDTEEETEPRGGGRHFRRGDTSDPGDGDVEGEGGRRRHRRFTWRVALFSLLVLGVIGGAFATIQWYGRSTYFVGFDGDDVAIFKGRPGGLLWIDPERVETTSLSRDEVPPDQVDGLQAGHEESSLSEAHSFVDNLEARVSEMRQTRTSSTSSSSSTTSTTAPTTTRPAVDGPARPAALTAP